MTKAPLFFLIELVRFDQVLNAYQDQQVALDNDRAAYYKHINALKQENAQNQQNYIAIKSVVYRLEKKLDELCTQQRTTEKKLSITANFKEYNSLEQQLRSIIEQQKVIEPQLETAWQDQDDCMNIVRTTKDINECQHKIITASIDDLDQQIVLLHEVMSKAAQQRSDVCSEVPQQLLIQYTDLQKKIKDPIVPLKNNNCSKCFYIVPPQKINNIFLYNLEQCSNCFRLLYAPSII